MDDEAQQDERASGQPESPSIDKSPDQAEPAPQATGARPGGGTSHRRRIVSDKGEIRDFETGPLPTSLSVQAAPPSTGEGASARKQEDGDGTGQAARTGAPTSTPHRVIPDLRHQEVVKGSHPGDRYVRYDRNVGQF